MKKLGGQPKELDLVLEVMKSKTRIFGKLILEAVCEEWIKTKGKELGSCCNIQMRDYYDLRIGWRGRLDQGNFKKVKINSNWNSVVRRQNGPVE